MGGCSPGRGKERVPWQDWHDVASPSSFSQPSCFQAFPRSRRRPSTSSRTFSHPDPRRVGRRSPSTRCGTWGPTCPSPSSPSPAPLSSATTKEWPGTCGSPSTSGQRWQLRAGQQLALSARRQHGRRRQVQRDRRAPIAGRRSFRDHLVLRRHQYALKIAKAVCTDACPFVVSTIQSGIGHHPQGAAHGGGLCPHRRSLDLLPEPVSAPATKPCGSVVRRGRRQLRRRRGGREVAVRQHPEQRGDRRIHRDRLRRRRVAPTSRSTIL